MLPAMRKTSMLHSADNVAPFHEIWRPKCPDWNYFQKTFRSLIWASLLSLDLRRVLPFRFWDQAGHLLSLSAFVIPSLFSLLCRQFFSWPDTTSWPKLFLWMSATHESRPTWSDIWATNDSFNTETNPVLTWSNSHCKTDSQMHNYDVDKITAEVPEVCVFVEISVGFCMKGVEPNTPYLCNYYSFYLSNISK